jgi:hypothetical protein
VNNKREHHAVPRLYLTGFVEPETSFVWAYARGRQFRPGKKKGRDNPYRAGVNVTTTKRDRYTIVAPDGSRQFNTIEDAMREWEELGKPALIAAREHRCLARPEKEHLARYIGCMWKRVEKRETHATEIYERELDRWAGLPLRFAELGVFGRAREAQAALDYLRSPNGQKYSLLRAAVDPLNMMHEGLLRMRWHLLVAPSSSYFVTSDAPVVFNEAAGLQKSSLGFPISAQIALLAEWTVGPDLEEVAVTSEQVRRFNEVIVRGAHKEVFAPRAEEWISEFLSESVDD